MWIVILAEIQESLLSGWSTAKAWKFRKCRESMFDLGDQMQASQGLRPVVAEEEGPWLFFAEIMADLENSEVRLVLQQQIFSPDQERLTLAIAVTPFDDKKRIRYLCLALGKDNAFIYIVKQDKKAFRKKPDSWPVSMLKEVSGRSPRGEPCLDFELSFGDQKKGNTYVWTTTSISDKNAFFVQLSRLARRFGDQQFPLRYSN